MNAAKCQGYFFCRSESKDKTFVNSIFRLPPPGTKKPKNSFLAFLSYDISKNPSTASF